jgi:CRISPR/Cas system CMR subunit Cmr6 (Cas7 group RAMP superfamily)
MTKKKEKDQETGLVPIKKESSSIVALSQTMTITTIEESMGAVNFLKRIKEAKQKVENFFELQIKSAYRTWQILLKQKKEYMDPLITAEKIVKDKKTKFDLKQEELAEKERKEIEEKARKEEERQRAKLQKKIDKATDEEIKAILQEEQEMVHVQRETATITTKTEGTAKQVDYEVEVYDTAALVRAIINNDIAMKLDLVIEVKTKGIKDYVKATGVTTIPGCKIKKTFIQRIL